MILFQTNENHFTPRDLAVALAYYTVVEKVTLARCRGAGEGVTWREFDRTGWREARRATGVGGARGFVKSGCVVSRPNIYGGRKTHVTYHRNNYDDRLEKLSLNRGSSSRGCSSRMND